MKAFEYLQPRNLAKVPEEKKTFLFKIIWKDIEKIVKETGWSEETAFEMYRRGTMGGERELGEW